MDKTSGPMIPSAIEPPVFLNKTAIRKNREVYAKLPRSCKSRETIRSPVVPERLPTSQNAVPARNPVSQQTMVIKCCGS